MVVVVVVVVMVTVAVRWAVIIGVAMNVVAVMKVLLLKQVV